MNSELLQLVTLTAFGNAALFERSQGLSITERPPAWLFQHNILQFDGITPLHGKDKAIFQQHSEELDGLRAFDRWIEYLVRDRVQRLWLGKTRRSGPLLAQLASAFANSCEQSIIAEYTDHAVAWTADWNGSSRGDKTYWKVRYQSRPVPLTRPTVDLIETKKQLRSVLLNAKDYALRGGGTHWAKIFSEALFYLENNVTLQKWDTLPTCGYSLEAWQLVRSVSHAWVFGGMGSWNDWFPSAESYQPRDFDNTIDADLFNCLNESLAAAVNSFDGNCSFRPQKTDSEDLSAVAYHSSAADSEDEAAAYHSSVEAQPLSPLRRYFAEFSNDRVRVYVTLFLIVLTIRLAIFLVRNR